MRPLSVVCDDQRLRHLDRIYRQAFQCCEGRAHLSHAPHLSTAKVRRRHVRHSSKCSLCTSYCSSVTPVCCLLSALAVVSLPLLCALLSSFHPSSTLTPSFVRRAHPLCFHDVRRRHWPHTLFSHSCPPCPGLVEHHGPKNVQQSGSS